MTFCRVLNAGTWYSLSIFYLSSTLERVLPDVIDAESYEKLIILILEMLEYKWRYKKKSIIQQYNRHFQVFFMLFSNSSTVEVSGRFTMDAILILLNGFEKLLQKRVRFNIELFGLILKTSFSWFLQNKTHLPEEENRSQTTYLSWWACTISLSCQG